MSHKKWFFIFAFVIALTSLTSMKSMAADGSSGCGPGWYLFKDNSLVSSAFRVTTNGILFPIVTIGMTFGTSECTRHKIVTREKESLHFVTMNYYELQNDIAKGEGQYLAAFAETLGCNPAVSAHFSSQMKQNYPALFESQAVNPEQTLLEVFKTIFRDSQLTQRCSLNVG